MNYLDYFILVTAVIGFLLGFKDGLIRKIIGLIGLIAGIFFAYKFAGGLGKFLNPVFNQDEYFSNVVAGILIFLLTVLIASIIKRLIHPNDKVNNFINQLIGGLIGVIQIIFFLSALFLFLSIFSFPGKETRNDSLIYNSVYNLIPSSIDLVIGQKDEASDFIKNMIEDKDKTSSPGIDSLK